MRKITKRSVAIITATVVAVGGAGAAWAAWSLNSSTSAEATAGTAAPLTVTGVTITGTLVPGSVGGVTFNARNTNSFPVQISNITYADITTDKSGDCPANNLQQVDNAPLPAAAALTLAAAGSSGDNKAIAYPGSLRLKPNPDNGCQGAKFSFKVNLTVASNS